MTIKSNVFVSIYIYIYYIYTERRQKIRSSRAKCTRCTRRIMHSSHCCARIFRNPRRSTYHTICTIVVFSARAYLYVYIYIICTCVYNLHLSRGLAATDVFFSLSETGDRKKIYARVYIYAHIIRIIIIYYTQTVYTGITTLQALCRAYSRRVVCYYYHVLYTCVQRLYTKYAWRGFYRTIRTVGEERCWKIARARKKKKNISLP